MTRTKAQSLHWLQEVMPLCVWRKWLKGPISPIRCGKWQVCFYLFHLGGQRMLTLTTWKQCKNVPPEHFIPTEHCSLFFHRTSFYVAWLLMFRQLSFLQKPGWKRSVQLGVIQFGVSVVQPGRFQSKEKKKDEKKRWMKVRFWTSLAAKRQIFLPPHNKY